MKIILIIIVVAVVIYFLVKSGNHGFWKLAGKHPDEALEFFSNSDCWYIVFPQEQKNKPEGNWDGPFYFFAGNMKIKIYGKVGEYEKKQEKFVAFIKNK